MVVTVGVSQRSLPPPPGTSRLDHRCCLVQIPPGDHSPTRPFRRHPLAPYGPPPGRRRMRRIPSRRRPPPPRAPLHIAPRGDLGPQRRGYARPDLTDRTALPPPSPWEGATPWVVVTGRWMWEVERGSGASRSYIRRSYPGSKCGRSCHAMTSTGGGAFPIELNSYCRG